VTIYWSGCGGGETRDTLIDGCAGGTAAARITADGLTVISTPVQSGVGALQVPAGVAAKGTLLGTTVSTQISVLQAYLNFNGNPNAIVPFFAPYSLTRTGAYIAEANATTRTTRICALGTDGDYATRTPLTPWSEAVIPSGSYGTGPVVFIIDPLTLGTNNVWLRLFIDGVEVFSFDAGVWPSGLGIADPTAYTVGTYGVAPNVALRIDDAVGLFSTSAADAPHLAAWPIAKVDAQHPISDTATHEWGVSGSFVGTYYDFWDDATGNDGDTTYLYSAQSAKTQTSNMESLATLGWNANATVFESATKIGPVLSCVHRTVGGTKFEGFGTTNLSSDVNVSDPGSTYVGNLYRLTHADTWARADAGTITSGLKTGTSDRDWRVTLMMLQWVICDNEFLPLVGAPMIPQGGIV